MMNPRDPFGPQFQFLKDTWGKPLVEWKPTGWWRAVDANGRVWAEASSEREIRRHARPGDKIQRHMRWTRERWEDRP